MSQAQKTPAPLEEIFVSLTQHVRWTEQGDGFVNARQLVQGRRTMDIIREFQIYLPRQVAQKHKQNLWRAQEKKFRQPGEAFRVRFNAKGKWRAENTPEHGKQLFFILHDMDTAEVRPIFEYYSNRPAHATA